MLGAGNSLKGVLGRFCSDVGATQGSCENAHQEAFNKACGGSVSTSCQDSYVRVVEGLQNACLRNNTPGRWQNICAYKEVGQDGSSYRFSIPELGGSHANAATHLRTLSQRGENSFSPMSSKALSTFSNGTIPTGSLSERYPLADLSFVITHEREWRAVTMKLPIASNMGRVWKEVTWHYYYMEGKGKHSLYWSNQPVKGGPGRAPHIEFVLQEGQFPADLLLVLEGQWKSGEVQVKVKLENG